MASVAPTEAAAGPIRIGAELARDLASTPDGREQFLVAGGKLFRAESGAPVSPGASVPAGRLLALDAQRLVVGEMPGCARGGGQPLRYTADGGNRWREAAGSAGQPLLATPWQMRGADVYALGCAGTLVSSDGGRTFRPVAALSIPGYDPRDLAVSPAGSTAYLTATSEGGTLRVVRAERQGGEWAGQTTVGTGWATGVLAVGPDDRVLLGTSLAVTMSRDRGATWQPLSTGLDAELLSTDPTRGMLSDADQSKLRAGVGIIALAFLGDQPVAATSHGVYALGPNNAWVRRTTTKTTRLIQAADALYAVTSDGLIRLSFR